MRHLLTKRRTEQCGVGESGVEESTARRSNRGEILWRVKERSVFFEASEKRAGRLGESIKRGGQSSVCDV